MLFRYVEAHSIKVKCDAMEKSEIEKHIKLKDDNFALKSENLIKQQSLEKNALSQKMNSEYEEMAKVKQMEMDKILNKYKNKKFDLETKQGKEKNLHLNENLLKANIFNANLVNFSNSENSEFINKSISKPASAVRLNSITDVKMKDVGNYLKKPEVKGVSKNAIGNKRPSKINLSGVTNANNGNSDKQMGSTNKSVKLFNYSGTAGSRPNPVSVNVNKNLQYSSAQN